MDALGYHVYYWTDGVGAAGFDEWCIPDAASNRIKRYDTITDALVDAAKLHSADVAKIEIVRTDAVPMSHSVEESRERIRP
jgi:hypothetical protein